MPQPKINLSFFLCQSKNCKFATNYLEIIAKLRL
nr:MAG TPA: hypothetical protein [Caudoviricetes sp.]